MSMCTPVPYASRLFVVPISQIGRWGFGGAALVVLGENDRTKRRGVLQTPHPYLDACSSAVALYWARSLKCEQRVYSMNSPRQGDAGRRPQKGNPKAQTGRGPNKPQNPHSGTVRHAGQFKRRTSAGSLLLLFPIPFGPRRFSTIFMIRTVGCSKSQRY